MLLLLAASLPAFGAGPPPGAASRVRIPVWLERSGNTPPARAADFSAALDGVPSRVLKVNAPGGDLFVLLVLDLVDDLTLINLAKQALDAEIHGLPRQTYVAVLRAQDNLKVLADPTTDRKTAAGAVLNLPVSGKPGLLDTVELAGRVADSVLAKDVRVALLYITDSDAANYREDFSNPVVNSSDSRDLSRKFPETLIQEKISRLAANLARQQTPLFVVHLKYRTDRLNEAYQNGLKTLAGATGGSALFCRSNAGIASVIRSGIEEVTSHYSLVLEAPPAPPSTLRVQITAPEGAQNLSYRTRIEVGKEK